VTTTTEFRLFGILVWSITRRTDITDEETVYTRLSDRFAAEMSAALSAIRKPQP
jgi:hypothetical protein